MSESGNTLSSCAEAAQNGSARETFASRLGTLATMIGVAVGLGNVWRFPYMVGEFGGSAFVLFYVLAVVLIGVPGLMAEWALGRETRRGTVGAFDRAGLPGGRALGWILFFGVSAATAYYTNVIGWVVYHGLAEFLAIGGVEIDAGRILPPREGFDAASFLLQALFTGLVMLACSVVLIRGLRRGIERASRIITPVLFVGLVVVIVRSVTLPGAFEGLDWLLLRFDPSGINGSVAIAAIGQVVFSLALGGTFMVVYGSYMNSEDNLGSNGLWTAVGDTSAGLLAGLAIFPAVFALGMAPGSGPGLIFSTLPAVFRQIPAGAVFGTIFFGALASAAYLSAVAAFEVLVAGLTDNTELSRKQATWTVIGTVFLLAMPPMINMSIFVPWDLTFGSGLQTLGALLAAVTVGWFMNREKVMAQLSGSTPFPNLLHFWIRFVIPGAILAVGAWWLLTDLLGVFGGV